MFILKSFSYCTGKDIRMEFILINQVLNKNITNETHIVIDLSGKSSKIYQ